jgi:hypothetical protein
VADPPSAADADVLAEAAWRSLSAEGAAAVSSPHG